MKNAIMMSVITAAALMSVGCSDVPPGQARDIGPVDVVTATTISRDILKQHFDIDPDATSIDYGTVKSLPKDIQAKNDRLLGNSAARQIAILNVRRSEGGTMVYLYIETQRYGSSNAYMQSPENRNYSGVPTETPAQMDAATSADQNQTWNFQARDNSQESKILNEIVTAANKAPAASPAAPAKK